MMRFIRSCLAGLLAVFCALFIAPSAQAQPIDCSAHILDKTSEQGIWFDTLEHSIREVKKIYSAADIYIHAYDYLPGGGSVPGFENLSGRCSNWFVEGSTIPRYNVLIVAYGQRDNLMSIQYGGAFELTMK